jgi:hypothetical protein
MSIGLAQTDVEARHEEPTGLPGRPAAVQGENATLMSEITGLLGLDALPSVSVPKLMLFAKPEARPDT